MLYIYSRHSKPRDIGAIKQEDVAELGTVCFGPDGADGGGDPRPG